MAKKNRMYQRLTRPIAGLAAYSSLWQGPDHLLLVKATGYTEEYHRFHYGDIQAISACESDRRLAWNIVWIVASVIALIPLILSLTDHKTPIVGGIVTAIILALLALNHFRGPTCRLFLITRVQTVRLPVVRRRKAEQLLGRLQPLIETAQADLLEDRAASPMAPPSVT